jgi:hypothetical protein
MTVLSGGAGYSNPAKLIGCDRQDQARVHEDLDIGFHDCPIR